MQTTSPRSILEKAKCDCRQGAARKPLAAIHYGTTTTAKEMYMDNQVGLHQRYVKENFAFCSIDTVSREIYHEMGGAR